VRSLQLKFSALVATLLVAASLGLAWIATRHERAALEAEVGKRGRALATNLVGVSQILLLEAGESPEEPLAIWEGRLTDAIVQQAGEEEGVVAARLIRREKSDSGEITEKIVASLNPDEHGQQGRFSLGSAEEPSATVIERRGDDLVVAAPVVLSGVLVGEAQIELDLGVLVEPVVAESQRQLGALAFAVLVLGIGGGIGFVALLVGPIRRLRSGVERLADGDLATRVPPTSRDEVGELTRAFNKMGESLLQKERIQKAFGRYASDYVLNTLLESPEGSELAGVEREVTILFADIRSFARLSEGLKAHDVVGLLNEIFQLASDCLLARGGTLDKFIGDSVMAYFGAPVPDPDHAVHAVSAAVDIVRAVAERNQQLGGEGYRVEIGIGIHTGIVVVGTIGSDLRTDFTAVGDAVNVAHRLEKLARPGEILVSEAVQRRVRGTVKLRFEGERQLSGRVEPVHVYSVDLSPPSARTVGGGEHVEPT
jgi:class 3 adenylate cyclase